MDQIQIADYLAKEKFNGELKVGKFVMLKNKQIYFEPYYAGLVISNQISPEDAFMYIDSRYYGNIESYNDPTTYLFPLINLFYSNYGVVESYLDKLGFYYYLIKYGFYNSRYLVYPATGLKYFDEVILFKDRLMIEIVDINTAATNTGLRKIVIDVLGKDILTQKEVSDDQIQKIGRKLEKQKLFAGHTAEEAYKIIEKYYINHNTSLAKEVLAIANAYNRVFEPYRVVYDTTTRQQVLM